MEVEKKIIELEHKVELLSSRLDIVNGQRLDMKDAYYDLKRAFETFVDQVATQISTALILPLIRTTIQANVNLPEAPDLLSVEFLYHEGRRIMEEMNRKHGETRDEITVKLPAPKPKKRKRKSTYVPKRVRLDLPETSALVQTHHIDEIPLFETIDRLKGLQ